MHNSFNITEEERRRILGIHENATKNSYLKIITEAAEDPTVPTAEILKRDAQTTFSACTCVTKMGWKRGIDSNNYAYYLNPNNKKAYFAMNDGTCAIYKTPEDSTKEKDFNCKQRPFVKPAQTLDELTSGKSNLQFGDKSPAVQTIQEFLKDAGKLPETFTVSDKFDKETQKAVIAFQKEKKLRVDGVVGKNTARALKTATLVNMEMKPVNPGDLFKNRDKEQDIKTEPKKDDSSGGMLSGVVDAMKQELDKSSYNMPEF